MGQAESRSQDARPWETHGAVRAAPSRKVKETILHPPKKGQGPDVKSTTKPISNTTFAADAGSETQVQICSPQTPSWEA